MKKKLNCYLMSHRRRCGFTQPELAKLLGCNSASVVLRFEKGKRHPDLATAFACEVLFGISAVELFPALFERIEDEALTRAYDLYHRLQGERSKAIRLKLDSLEAAFDRHSKRIKQKEV
jgi:transcriptional regulator with XRE-family HTH domain